MRQIPKIKNLVIKIGSNILTDSEKAINEDRIELIAGIVAEVKKTVPHVTVVSSGAIAAGFKLLGFKKRPREITDKQACASVGQARLMWFYEHAFVKYGMHAAQVLITKHDFSNRARYLNARATLKRLLDLGAVPVINENDVVVVNELKYIESFGDNDNLSALVAGLIDADMLLILSDVDGLYTGDPSKSPDAKLINEVSSIDADIMSLAGSATSGVGTGGMRSKLLAAEKALQAGCCVGIISGKDPDNVIRFLNGENVGTYFSNPAGLKDRKKLWLSYATIPRGSVCVDAGAKDALLYSHSSLLASGIKSVQGNFHSKDVVQIIDEDSNVIALGTTRYSSKDLEKIAGKKSADISMELGRKSSGIVIHCDEMGFI